MRTLKNTKIWYNKPYNMVEKLTQADKDAIVAALKGKQATRKELADRYKVSAYIISNVFMEITGRALRNRSTQSDREAIVAALNAGDATVGELSIRYGILAPAIRRIYKNETGKPCKTTTSHTDINVKASERLAGEKPERGKEPAANAGTIVDKPEQSSVYQEKDIQTVDVKILDCASKVSQYRAWHKEEKKMYPVLGLNWLDSTVLIERSDTTTWCDMQLFNIMQWSGMRDLTRTPEFPEGQPIYVGDIVQFPISVEENGRTSRVMRTDIVTFDTEVGWFIVVELEDGLSLYNDCFVLGTVYANPDLVSKQAYETWCAFRRGGCY